MFATTRLRKEDDELQIVWGEVYIPDVPDSQGDFMSADEIRKMAYGFLANGRVGQIDINHDNKLYGCYVVESFIARDGDPMFISGSWVLGVHIPDADIWSLVKTGKLNGFSLQAVALSQEVELELTVPESLTGETDNVNGHTHTFSVALDQDAQFLGGRTGFSAGHFHMIKRGSVTEPAGEDGHTHRFAYLDEFVDAQGKG